MNLNSWLLSALMASLLAFPALGQTVRIQGQEIPYKLVDGKQLVSRKALAEVFPGFPLDGSQEVDLARLMDDPNARVMKRNGLIISVRYYSSNMARLYSRAGEKIEPRSYGDESAEKTAPNGDYRAILNEIVRLSNIEREKHGVPPLSPDPILEKAAIGHSREMAKLKYFSHTSPVEGRTNPSNRIALAGASPRATGENIAKFTGHAESTLAEKSVIGWMNSPPHRKNLLSPMFTHIGVGVGKNGRTYWLTQNFGAY